MYVDEAAQLEELSEKRKHTFINTKIKWTKAEPKPLYTQLHFSTSAVQQSVNEKFNAGTLKKYLANRPQLRQHIAIG